MKDTHLQTELNIRHQLYYEMNTCINKHRANLITVFSRGQNLRFSVIGNGFASNTGHLETQH